jgi:hypothetical protein
MDDAALSYMRIVTWHAPAVLYGQLSVVELLGEVALSLGELLEAELYFRAGLLGEPDNADLNALNRKLK